jgi:hypothetical protein
VDSKIALKWRIRLQCRTYWAPLHPPTAARRDPPNACRINERTLVNRRGNVKKQDGDGVIDRLLLRTAKARQRMTSDDHQYGKGMDLAPQRAEHDFSRVLLKTIESIKHDPAQFRNLIYEMARVHLQREAWHRNPPMNILELRRMMLELETAIERVETASSQEDSTPRLAPPAQTEILSRGSLGSLSAADSFVVIDQGPSSRTRQPDQTQIPPQLKAIMRLGLVAALAAVIVVVAVRQFHLFSSAPRTNVAVAQQNATGGEKTAQEKAVPPPLAPSGPLPSVYGVYAVNNGTLHELEALVGRVPDQRVFMSTTIKTPSHTILPDGRVTFIVYRREIASNAPERAAVRVIAKIARAMTFNKAGQATTAKVDDTWTFRNVSFEFRVAPVSESAEMVSIRPENDDFTFPAGRYGLVIKGQAYDFTVAGPITEPAQCLEQVEAANGTFYYECKNL